jgi:hypothetical protein
MSISRFNLINSSLIINTAPSDLAVPVVTTVFRDYLNPTSCWRKTDYNTAMDQYGLVTGDITKSTQRSDIILLLQGKWLQEHDTVSMHSDS